MESMEIVEITDTSISIEAHLKDITIEPASTKRPLELDESELEVQICKKPCPESETHKEGNSLLELFLPDDATETETDNTTILDETVVPDETAQGDSNILDQNISSKDEVIEEEEPILQELPSSQEIIDEEEADEGEEEEEGDFHESENIDSSEEDNDEELMARAQARAIAAASATVRLPQISNDEPIALDDSDDEVENQQNYQSDSEFSVDNNVIGEDSDDEVERLVRRKISRQRFLAEKILKKSLKFLRKKRFVRSKHPEKEDPQIVEEVPKIQEQEEKVVQQAEPVSNITAKKDTPAEVVPMDVKQEEKSEVKSPRQSVSLPPSDPIVRESSSVTSNENLIGKEKNPPNVEVLKKTPEHNNGTSSSLLEEITDLSVEEIFNRYVLKPPSDIATQSLDEFSEELFVCLQQNKQELEKAAQLWNEKLHIKYKIRELMESMRRHRAVVEIETFGYKQPNNSHPIISSKSSTTTNSEADHHEKQFRMSSESVTRLIQDVRATMLKREDKHQPEESWNSMQVGQGRQGQIIDVQSIINDFRQKNPQEVPRRGRRMKGSSFGFDGQQMDETRGTSSSNNSHDFSGSSRPGYPEVSLLPVQNFYKNLSNQIPGSSGTAGSYSGQKSSLLQSILTKQSTKSPAGSGFHPNHSLPSTSTLARLLTAPERSIQGTPKHHLVPASARQSSKVHHNGEITITPIAHHSGSRSKDFSMDDEDNSMEPPLVIDETEDLSFDIGERSMNKSVSDLLCQGCKKNKAFFMCAGCSRQWYCSKECQELAWDEHAESCMT